MTTLISVIVTTYNWPNALMTCLTSLLAQHDQNFEIIIADDGSTDETRTLIKTLSLTSRIAISHIFHADRGFRAGTIRNKAVAASHGEYLLFIDGDCVVFPNFIQRHRQLSEIGYFIPGNRLLLNQRYTQQILEQQIPLHTFSYLNFLGLWVQRKINRLFPLLYIPVHGWRYHRAHMWQKAMTCNLAVWKNDFIAVNGFDELFEGWGYEDSDLVIRLIHQGIKRKEGRFAVPVLHLWHPQNDRSKHDQNYMRLLERLNDPTLIRAKQGFDQY